MYITALASATVILTPPVACSKVADIYLSMYYVYDGMARKTGYLETILPDIAETPNFQAMLRVDERHSIRNKKSLRAF